MFRVLLTRCRTFAAPEVFAVAMIVHEAENRNAVMVTLEGASVDTRNCDSFRRYPCLFLMGLLAALPNVAPATKCEIVIEACQFDDGNVRVSLTGHEYADGQSCIRTFLVATTPANTGAYWPSSSAAARRC